MTLSITFLRHANARPATDALETSDQARPLSPKGIDQAATRREALGNRNYSLVLCSPTIRTIHTSEIVSGNPRQRTFVSELLPYQGEKMDALFAKLAYAPLSTYRKEDGGLVDEVARQAHVAIVRCIKSRTKIESVPDYKDYRVLVVGHAVVLNALGCAFLHKEGRQGAGSLQLQGELAELALGEACGFTLVFDGDNIQAREIHQ
jgi:phosphohistidine phosphatase SixA